MESMRGLDLVVTAKEGRSVWQGQEDNGGEGTVDARGTVPGVAGGTTTIMITGPNGTDGHDAGDRDDGAGRRVNEPATDAVRCGDGGRATPRAATESCPVGAWGIQSQVGPTPTATSLPH